MKITNFALTLVASICIFTSCSNEVNETVDKDVKVKKVFGVGTNSAASRTAIIGWNSGSSTQEVHWSGNENITVFAEGRSKGETFSFKNYYSGETNNIAEFEGYTYERKKYYILYPAQNNARLNGDKVTLNIPAIQTATKNSFDPKANIQLGASNLGDRTGLSNVCAYFRITVPSNCNKVTVEATNSTWYLAGTVIVDDIHSAGNHISSFNSDCTNKIELTGITEEGTYFIAFIPTTSMSSGIKVTLDKVGGSPVTKTFTSNAEGFNFVAGNYYNLGESW